MPAETEKLYLLESNAQVQMYTLTRAYSVALSGVLGIKTLQVVQRMSRQTGQHEQICVYMYSDYNVNNSVIILPGKPVKNNIIRQQYKNANKGSL